MSAELAEPSIPREYALEQVVASSTSRSAVSPGRGSSRKGKEREVLKHEAVVEEAGGDDDTDVGSSDDEMDQYERERQRRIRENHRLMTSLGIQPLLSRTNSSSWPNPDASPSQSSPHVKRSRPRLYDRNGHIISLPKPGEVHRFACVEVRPDRALRRRIAEGEYVDCTAWGEGEAYRQRFGRGRGGTLGAGEAVEMGGVGEGFRWKRWGWWEREKRREIRRREERNQRDRRGEGETGEVSAYSLIPGQACHQCKRKSEKLKMRCRNLNPPCRASFCETCCRRYSYFTFDPESRSFICPLCKDCCNCSNCMRKRHLHHLLDGRNGLNLRHLQKQVGEDVTIEAWLEGLAGEGQAAQLVGRAAPFDRVRLVNQDEDVISPELPPEPVEPKVKAKKGEGKSRSKRKRKKVEGEVDGDAAPKKRRQTGKRKAGEPGAGPQGTKVILKLKLPNAPPPPPLPVRPQPREKVYDSDGDTVGGWSDDDDEEQAAVASMQSTLTPLSDSPTPPPLPFAPTPRFAFPPRPDMATLPPATLEYISTLGGGRERASPLGDEALLQALGALEATLPMPQQADVEGSAMTELVEPSPRKRRLPPPSANIVRQPRFAATRPGIPGSSDDHQVDLLSVPSAAEDHHLLLDTFLSPAPPPPAFGHTHSGPPHHHHQANMQHLLAPHQNPPPYSHSPPRARQSTLPDGGVASKRRAWPETLDLLSLAASEARNSPAAAGEQDGGRSFWKQGGT